MRKWPRRCPARLVTPSPPGSSPGSGTAAPSARSWLSVRVFMFRRRPSSYRSLPDPAPAQVTRRDARFPLARRTRRALPWPTLSRPRSLPDVAARSLVRLRRRLAGRAARPGPRGRLVALHRLGLGPLPAPGHRPGGAGGAARGARGGLGAARLGQPLAAALVGRGRLHGAGARPRARVHRRGPLHLLPAHRPPPLAPHPAAELPHLPAPLHPRHHRQAPRRVGPRRRLEDRPRRARQARIQGAVRRERLRLPLPPVGRDGHRLRVRRRRGGPDGDPGRPAPGLAAAIGSAAPLRGQPRRHRHPRHGHLGAPLARGPARGPHAARLRLPPPRLRPLRRRAQGAGPGRQVRAVPLPAPRLPRREHQGERRHPHRRRPGHRAARAEVRAGPGHARPRRRPARQGDGLAGGQRPRPLAGPALLHRSATRTPSSTRARRSSSPRCRSRAPPAKSGGSPRPPWSQRDPLPARAAHAQAPHQERAERDGGRPRRAGDPHGRVRPRARAVPLGPRGPDRTRAPRAGSASARAGRAPATG